jgi:hypothetical protein
MMSELGQQQQQHQQNLLDSAYEQFLRKEENPYEQLEMRKNLLYALPFATNKSTVTRNAPQPRLNTAGNLGALAMAILGARRKGMFGGE